MTQPHDYAAALADMEACLTPSSIARGYSHVKGCEDKTVLAIRHALKVADRLMQEPSTDMLITIGGYDPHSIFESLRDQLLAEAGE